MYITTNGIILKNINYKETSVISRIFTEDYGKISVIFKGAKRKNHNISPVIELANVVNITYYSKAKSNLNTSKEVSLLNSHPNAHKVLLNYYYNMAIISLLDKLCHEEYAHRNLYNTAIDALKLIDLNQYNIEIIFLHFLLNLNTDLGFKISVDDLALHSMIDDIANNIKNIKAIDRNQQGVKDMINKIKILIYKNMQNNLIDLNDIYAIKMLKNKINEQ